MIFSLLHKLVACDHVSTKRETSNFWRSLDLTRGVRCGVAQAKPEESENPIFSLGRGNLTCPREGKAAKKGKCIVLLGQW